MDSDDWKEIKESVEVDSSKTLYKYGGKISEDFIFHKILASYEELISLYTIPEKRKYVRKCIKNMLKICPQMKDIIKARGKK